MTYEYLIVFALGYIVGYISFRHKDDKEQQRIYEERYLQHQEEIAYYKKLTKTLAEENSEFRRKQ